MAAIMMVSLDSAATQSCGAPGLSAHCRSLYSRQMKPEAPAQCKHKPSSGVMFGLCPPATLAEVSADNQPSVQAA